MNMIEDFQELPKKGRASLGMHRICLVQALAHMHSYSNGAEGLTAVKKQWQGWGAIQNENGRCAVVTTPGNPHDDHHQRGTKI